MAPLSSWLNAASGSPKSNDATSRRNGHLKLRRVKPSAWVEVDQTGLSEHDSISSGMGSTGKSDAQTTVIVLQQAQSGFDGYVGTESFSPIAGIQDNWMAVVRFESADHLDAWMHSPERRDLVRAGTGIFDDMSVRRVASGFGSWFGAEEGRGLPLWKQAAAVFVALYPLTLIITLWGTDPLHLPLSTGLLIGDVVSVALLSYLLMPLTNRLLGFWLKPTRDVKFMTTMGGVLAIGIFTVAVWLLFTYTIPGSGPHLEQQHAVEAK